VWSVECGVRSVKRDVGKCRQWGVECGMWSGI
jgi:hypothetical protein